MQYNITYRKKDKGIQFIISYKDSMGKWKQKSKQGFKKQSLAKIAADEALQELKKRLELQSKLNPDSEKMAFSEFKTMFLKHEELYKEGNTLISYKTAFNNFSILNDIEMVKIKPVNIQECVDDLIRRGLKTTTIKRYINRINSAFNSAKKNKIIIENPVQNIDIPKTKIKEEKTALTKYELEDLLNKIKNNKYKIISVLAGKCGLRLGEIVGLTWHNVNEKKLTLRICQQWKKLKNGKYGLGEVKSENSNREVPVSPKVMQQLIKYKNETPTNFDNRVFNNCCNETLANNLKSTYKKLGYDISIHELRHTFATILVSNGIDFKTIAQILGHDVEQTIKTYSHVTNDMLSNASKLIRNIF